MFTWLVETSRGRGLGSSNEEEPGRQWSNIGAGGKEHLYYRSRLQEAEDPQVSRSYLWLSRSVYFFFTESDYIYKNPIKKKKFFFQVICTWQARFLPLRGVSFEKKHQNGVERGRRTATLPHFCNHDVDEQQAAFQYAPHPARTQIHSSALQLRGHPQSLPSHTVGESRIHSWLPAALTKLPVPSDNVENVFSLFLISIHVMQYKII